MGRKRRKGGGQRSRRGCRNEVGMRTPRRDGWNADAGGAAGGWRMPEGGRDVGSSQARSLACAGSEGRLGADVEGRSGAGVGGKSGCRHRKRSALGADAGGSVGGARVPKARRWERGCQKRGGWGAGGSQVRSLADADASRARAAIRATKRRLARRKTRRGPGRLARRGGAR